MPIDTSAVPDYELDDKIELNSAAQLRALADPIRSMILDLLLERAATVTELASAIGRPKSTVAHHVAVLVHVGMLKVVRTRRVRAIEERHYGRTARLFMVGVVFKPGDAALAVHANNLSVAAAESLPAHQADTLRSVLRHARIPRERAREFWSEVEVLLREFSSMPRDGDTVYGFAVGLYPTEHPALPERKELDPDA